jgi:hypothetical protein
MHRKQEVLSSNPSADKKKKKRKEQEEEEEEEKYLNPHTLLVGMKVSKNRYGKQYGGSLKNLK